LLALYVLNQRHTKNLNSKLQKREKLSYSSWTVDKSCKNIDPINLEFENIKMREIRDHLSYKGWKKPLFQWDQFLPNKINQNDKIPQEDSLILGNELYRYHMRLWNINKKTIVANVHYDTYTIFRGHVALQYEEAEKKVATEFKNDSFNISPDAINLGNIVQSPLNNGKATKIWR